MTRRTALSLLALVPAAPCLAGSSMHNMVLFEMDGRVVAQYRVPVGSEVVIYDHGQRIFGGYIGYGEPGLLHGRYRVDRKL